MLSRISQLLFSYSKILVGVSGGIDSMVLCYLLKKTNIDFAIAHCNFNLRGEESDNDEKFVYEIAKKYKVDFFSKKFTPPSSNIQVWARDSRYDWFEKIRQENNFDKTAIAHHLDDKVETFLINFIRGTGLEGLTGIKFENKNIIRPLLNFSRDEILKYAKDNNLKWREDSSNKSTKYFRNNLRHNIIPELKLLNDNFLNSFKNTLENLRNVDDYYKIKIKEDINFIKKDYKNALFSINIKNLNNHFNPKLLLYEILKEYGFSNMIDDILKTTSSGKKFYDNGYCLSTDRELFVLSKCKAKNNEKYLIYEDTQSILNPLPLEFKINKVKDYSKNNIICLDYSKLKFPLILRKWKEGDYFYPFGMKGKKKLSKYFKDEKLSNVEKENIWLLCSNKDILWIIGKRIDDRYKISDSTEKVYSIYKK